ncbi:hypothetical protein LguiA_018027 [Lonicera macranthoides]
MVRSIVKYEFIANERQRKQTFRKRKANLLKKLSELKTLCDVDACAVIYNNGAEPEFWPSAQEACHVVERFDNIPTMTQTENTMNKEGMLLKNISKLEKELEIQKEKNGLLEDLLKNDASNLRNVDDLSGVLNLLDEKLSYVNLEISKRSSPLKDKI